MSMGRGSARRMVAGAGVVAVVAGTTSVPALLLAPAVEALRALVRPSTDPTATAITALLASVALGASCWLALGTVVAAIGRGAPRLHRWTRVPTRRLVESLLAVALSGAASIGVAVPLAGAASTTTAPLPPPARIQLDVGPDGRFVVRAERPATLPVSPATVASAPSPPSSTTTTTTTTAPPAPAPHAHPTPIAPPPPATPPREHVVRPGEHLWSISRDALGQHLGRVPTDAELAPYWRRVCEHNRERVRSRDVDLVFPGEIIVVPEPRAARP